MSEPLVVTALESPQIVSITLNRPLKRNALSLELIEEVTSAVHAAHLDKSRRVLILKGNGPVFCAGLDLKEAAVAKNAEESAEALSRMFAAIGSSPLITIAAAQGAAMGGGAGLLAACDFAVAADDLIISYPEVRRGLVAALVTCLLRRQVSDHIARELILLGGHVSAARGLSLGLLSRVTTNSKLMSVTIELADEACNGAPGAISRSKRLLDALSPRPLLDDLRIAMQYHLSSRNSTECIEGSRAFVEKRKPQWGPREE